MLAWWESMTLLMQICAGIAIPATIALVIQTLLLLIGMGHEADVDADTSGIGDGGHDMGDADFDADFDMDGDAPDGFDANADAGDGGDGMVYDPGLRVFTLRGLIAFFAVGGWLGVALLESGIHSALALLLAFLGGVVAMVFVAWVFKAALRLQYNGTMDLKNAIGQQGTVYITVPPLGHGSGKISIIIQESLRELDAVNSGELPIPTGREVRVIDVVGTALRVEPLSQTKHI